MAKRRRSDKADDDGYGEQRRPRRVRKRGILEKMPDMPIDVLIEIMKYLMPLDLVNLTRTSRDFRRFLLARSALPLWRTARENAVGLPPCPPHLSEPAYANLAFSSHCHSCSKPGIKTILWQFSARYCPACRQHMLVKCPNSWSCVFTESCEDMIVTYMLDRSEKSDAHWHHAPEVDEIAEGEGIPMLPGLTEEQVWDAHKARVTAIMDFAATCEVWQEDMTELRQNEIQETRTRRLFAVVEKLREIGWGDELDIMAPDYEELAEHQDVKQTKDLTPRIWQNIEGRLVEFMQYHQDSRLAWERKELWKQRCDIFVRLYRLWYNAQDDKRGLPRAVDLMLTDTIWAMFMLPAETDMLPVYNAVFEHLPIMAAQWRQRCDEQLREIVRNSDAFKDRIPEGVDPLTLASVVFTCKSCSAHSVTSKKLPSLYPGILTHDCLWERADPYNIVAGNDSLESVILLASSRGRSWRGDGAACLAWSCESLEIGVLHRRVAGIIRACGKDPLKATREEMDGLRVRLWCKGESCDHSDTYRRVKNWRNAIWHVLGHDESLGRPEPGAFGPTHSDYRPVWKVMSGDIVNTIIDVEESASEYFEKREDADGTYWCCSHCFADDLPLSEVIPHLRLQHDMAPEDMSDGDFYRHPDSIEPDMRASRSIALIKRRQVGGLSRREQLMLHHGIGVICDF